MTYLTRVNLRTGSRDIVRPEAVSQEALTVVQQLIDEALASDALVPLPPEFPGYGLRAWSKSHHALTARLYFNGSVQIITTGVALRSKQGARLWREMMTTAIPPLPLTDVDRPPAPFILDRPEADGAQKPEAFTWTGDLTQCIGVAWMDRGC